MGIANPGGLMRRAASAAVFTAAFAVSTGTIAPAVAVPTGLPVHIVAHTSFLTEASEFDSSISGCEEGTVLNGENAAAHFTPWGGVFTGYKEFTCEGGESGFTLRVTARFGGAGSTGSWTVVSGFGDFEGVRGSGSLVGIPIDDTQIDDVYTGSFR
jgi:hypothetical protein